MLNYLTTSTGPETLFAIHPCAHYLSNAKLIHERAVKQIIRYLKGSADKGLRLTPNPQDGIKRHADVDFAGGYSEDTRDDPISVYSCT